MACACFLRANEVCRNLVAQRSKVLRDFIKSEVKMVGDVFEKAEFGVDFFDNAFDVGPDVARVVGAPALAGGAEWLAGIATCDDIHFSTPRVAIEGFNVVPDRSAIQGLVFHPGHESSRLVCFPLDVTDSSIFRLCDVQPEFESAVSGT